jgi:RND family efflux transporter MFP subunit
MLEAMKMEHGLVAPFDGVVTERGVHPGALVGPPASASTPPLLRVEQVARLRLTVAVPESYASAVKQGAVADFAVRSWPREKFHAQVQRIAHSLDAKTRTMAVELDVDNKDGRLAPGMFAQVEWSLARTVPSLLVPPPSIVRTTERTFVDRVRDGVVEQVSVQLGVTAGERVEVFGALEAGDVILKRGREELATGSHVQTMATVNKK